MNLIQVVSWIATGVFIVAGVTKFTINYLKGRKEILKKDYDEEINTANLLKELYEMADNEDKDSIIDMVNDNMEYIYDTNTVLSHKPEKVSNITTSYLFYEELETFNFRISEELNELFLKKDFIYTATKGYEGNYKVTTQGDCKEEKYYENNIVKYYIENGQWIIIINN